MSLERGGRARHLALATPPPPPEDGALGPRAQRELLALPAGLLGSLPVPPVLALRIGGWVGPTIAVALEPGEADARRRLGEVVIDAAAWGALVEGAEADRLHAPDFVSLLLRMRATGASIGSDDTLAGVLPEPPAGWTLARLLDRLGASLVAAFAPDAPVAAEVPLAS